jgi:cell division protein FtsB
MTKKTSYKLIYIFLALAAAAVYFSSSNIKNILNLKQRVSSYEEKLEMLKKENKRLARELEWVETEEDYIKYLARKKLGLVEPYEIKYFLVEAKSSDK